MKTLFQNTEHTLKKGLDDFFTNGQFPGWNPKRWEENWISRLGTAADTQVQFLTSYRRQSKNSLGVPIALCFGAAHYRFLPSLFIFLVVFFSTFQTEIDAKPWLSSIPIISTCSLASLGEARGKEPRVVHRPRCGGRWGSGEGRGGPPSSGDTPAAPPRTRAPAARARLGIAEAWCHRRGGSLSGT